MGVAGNDADDDLPSFPEGRVVPKSRTELSLLLLLLLSHVGRDARQMNVNDDTHTRSVARRLHAVSPP